MAQWLVRTVVDVLGTLLLLALMLGVFGGFAILALGQFYNQG